MKIGEKICKAHTVLRGETASNVVYEHEHEYHCASREEISNTINFRLLQVSTNILATH